MARKLRGNTTLDMIRSGESERNSFRPTIGTTTTISSPASNPAMLNQSYNEMIGGSSSEFGGAGFGAGIPSMASLEVASMRLADAASKRNIREMEAESEIKNKNTALMQGYSSPAMMQYDLQKKRREQEQEQEKQKQYTIDRRGRRIYT
jgi:hypothetical protein